MSVLEQNNSLKSRSMVEKSSLTICHSPSDELSQIHYKNHSIGSESGTCFAISKFMKRNIQNYDARPVPTVSKCSNQTCVFNGAGQCRAQSITVSEGMMTRCDTYLASLVHIDDNAQIAGVGKCHVTSCALNQNLECTARQVRMGKINGLPGCLDFIARTA